MLAGRVVHGLGRIESPLAVVRLNGRTKLVIDPIAALGTDAALVATSTALFFSTRSLPLKLLSLLGGTWGLVAAGVETAKLLREPEARYKELFEV